MNASTTEIHDTGMVTPPTSGKKRNKKLIMTGMETAIAIPMMRPGTADQHSFREKLIQDGVTASADRFANADFPRSLGHGDQHDVHNPDAADGKRDQGNENQQDG